MGLTKWAYKQNVDQLDVQRIFFTLSAVSLALAAAAAAVFRMQNVIMHLRRLRLRRQGCSVTLQQLGSAAAAP